MRDVNTSVDELIDDDDSDPE